jgi:hypothetical protein
MEVRWRAEVESVQSSSYYATSYSSWLSFGTSLIANIIENLQVSSQRNRSLQGILICSIVNGKKTEVRKITAA